MKNVYLLFLTLFLTYSALSQPIIYVTPSGAGNLAGTSWTNALPGSALPNKLVSASAGTQFWVAAGTYKPTTTTDRTASLSIASGLSVYGGFSGTETALTQRIDGLETVFSGDIGAKGSSDDNSQHVISLYNIGQTVVLDHLTIRDGHLKAFDPASAGAGVNIDITNNDLSVRISSCHFDNNSINQSLSGGGAVGVTAWSNGHCSISLKHCRFTNNVAGFGGAYTPQTMGGTIVSSLEDCAFNDNRGLSESGAISNRYVAADANSLTIKNCTFVGNTALFLGGALTTGAGICTIESCYFRSNVTTNLAIDGLNAGGAIDGNDSKALFRNCTFSDNSAANGGVVIGNASTLRFINCQFDSNHARFGGVAYSLSSLSETHQSFLNCTFVSNVAAISGGVFCNLLVDQADADPQTIPANRTSLTNCIVWNNTATNESVFVPQSARNLAGDRIDNQFSTTYSLIQSGYPGVGNVYADPSFIDLSTNNVRLNPNSPAVNAGDPNSSGLPATDLRGNPRVQGGRVDMGAFEVASCVGLPCIPFILARKK
jgi:hypothetical protein